MEITNLDATEVLLLLALVMTPTAVVLIVGILRGYHMDLKVWRTGYGRRHERRDNGDD